MATRLIRLTLAMLASLWLAACGGGGGGGNPPSTDTEAPRFVSVTPANGATDVPTDTSIVALFSEAITCAATTIEVGGVPAEVSCSGKELTAQPKSKLPSGKTVATVLPAPSDLVGNVGATTALAFTTKLAADTLPPKLLSTSIADGATRVSVPLPAVTYTFDETIVCDKPALTLLSSGHSIAGTAVCTGTALVFTPDAASAAFYGADYALTLPAGVVADLAGNAFATARVIHFTTAKLALGPRLYTANSGANHDNGEEYVSRIDLVDYTVTPIAFTGDNSDSYQSFVAVDAATGLVYSSGFQTTRGIDVIDMPTGARSNFELDPNPDTTESIRGLALGPAGVYVVYANSRFDSDKTIRNRVLRFDRLNHREVMRSVPLADLLPDQPGAMTPTAIVVHPDAARKRLYVLSSDMNAMNTIDMSCTAGWYYEPGTVGRVTELDAETLEIRRTFVVGSVPIAAVVDLAGDRLIVANAGDQSFSVIDLKAGTVADPVRPPSLTKCRQPQHGSLLLDRTGKLWVTNTFDGVHVFDRNLVETAFIATGEKSAPRGITTAGDRVYVTLWNLTTSGVAEIVGTTITRTISAPMYPYGIGAYTPAP